MQTQTNEIIEINVILSLDVVNYILDMAIIITNGKTYKSIIQLSKDCNTLHSTTKNKNRHCNQLLTLLELFPDGAWNWKSLTVNPNITYEYMRNHKELPWFMSEIPLNPTVHFGDLEGIYNDLCTWYNTKYALGLNGLQYYRAKFCGIIRGNNSKGKFYSAQNMNPNITIDNIIEVDKDFDDDFQLNRVMCSKPNIKFEMMEQYPQFGWNAKGFAYNPSTTLAIIENNIEMFKEECWELSRNPNITIEFVKNHLEWEWTWESLSSNSGITTDDIDNNPDLPWEWEWVYHNPNTTIDYIYKNADKMKIDEEDDDSEGFEDEEDVIGEDGLDWYTISRHKNTTMEYINKHPDLPWQISGWVKNPNLTADFVLKHIDDKKWGHRFASISSNRFGK